MKNSQRESALAILRAEFPRVVLKDEDQFLDIVEKRFVTGELFDLSKVLRELAPGNGFRVEIRPDVPPSLEGMLFEVYSDEQERPVYVGGIMLDRAGRQWRVHCSYWPNGWRYHPHPTSYQPWLYYLH